MPLAAASASLDDFVNCYFGRARPLGAPKGEAVDKSSRKPAGTEERTPQRGVPTNRHERKETDRFKRFTDEELTKRDKLLITLPMCPA